MPAYLGQHFLTSEGHRKRIVDALGLSATKGGENVLEIGPGRGALTDLLLEKVAEKAGRLVVIEVDPVLASGLREKHKGRVEVIEGDVLQVAWPEFNGQAKVVGNLPYYITSPILMRLFEHADRIETIVVMVQREVAERITASPGTRDYGLLTVTARYFTEPKLLFTIPPGAFFPRPKVESAVVAMKVAPKRMADEASFFRMAKAAFAHKRKTLVNNLKVLYEVDVIKAALEASRLGESVRGEELSLEEFERLFLRLSGSLAR